MNDGKGPDLSVLRPDRNLGYRQWPLPCDRDEAIISIVAAARKHSNSGLLKPDHVPVLLAFSERMAILSRREESHRYVRLGLDAICLAAGSGDDRELVAVLTLLWRSAEVLGLDSAEELLSTVDRCRGACADLFVSFLERDGEDRSIESMGYVEVTDVDGFRYERNW